MNYPNSKTPVNPTPEPYDEPRTQEDMGANIKETEDSWQHRSFLMTCSTCMWFVEKEAEVPRDSGMLHQRIGRCRRHAPAMNGYPVVYPRDWCGDHKIDENKT